MLISMGHLFCDLEHVELELDTSVEKINLARVQEDFIWRKLK